MVIDIIYNHCKTNYEKIINKCLYNLVEQILASNLNYFFKC